MRERARLEADFFHRLAEQLTVLGLVDSLGLGTDQLDAVLVENALLVKRQGGVERRLATHRRQDRVRPLLGDDLSHDLGRDRLDVGRVRQIRVGHDRRGIGVDEDDPIALGPQSLAGLSAGIVELARLADDDRACADDENRIDVSSFWHAAQEFGRGSRGWRGRLRGG